MQSQTKSKSEIKTKINMPGTTTTIRVKKRDGSLEPLDINKIHFVVEEACENLPGISASLIEMKDRRAHV